jgi:LysM repeat protein
MIFKSLLISLTVLNAIFAMNVQDGQVFLQQVSCPFWHTVLEGESFASIASMFNIDMNYLLTHNNLSDPNLLTVGQILSIPCPITDYSLLNTTDSTMVMEIPRVELDCPKEYTVVAGDTLESIALRFNIPFWMLVDFNEMLTSDLVLGSTLMIPCPMESTLPMESMEPLVTWRRRRDDYDDDY